MVRVIGLVRLCQLWEQIQRFKLGNDLEGMQDFNIQRVQIRIFKKGTLLLAGSNFKGKHFKTLGEIVLLSWWCVYNAASLRNIFDVALIKPC